MPESSPPAAPRGRDDAPTRAPDAKPRLLDPWSRRGALPLDGWLESTGGPRLWPWFAAVAVLVALFVAFNLVGGVVGGVLLAVQGVGMETQPGMDLAELQRQIPPDVTIISNSVGQALGLGLPILGVAWLHSSRVWGFLRLRRVPWQALVLGLVGMAALLPVIGWLAEINQGVPLPDMLQQMEDARMETIRRVIESDLGIVATLAALAVVPALCEEVAFRGYAQRQFERSAGVVGSILITGVFFGVYHFSFAQVLPLTVLGFYLAYLTWRTGSLWPAILVHFANNAFSVVGAHVAAQRPDVTLAEMETTSWPWYAVAGGLILLAAVLFLLHTQAPRWQPDKTE